MGETAPEQIQKYRRSKRTLSYEPFIILYNVFGDATTPLLFYKLDEDLWSILKTFVMYLERLPEFPITKLHDITVDEKCLEVLNDL